MIISIILITVVGTGIYFSTKGWEYEFSAAMLLIFGGIFLATHILFISVASYDYEMYVTKRESFTQTLKNSREGDRPLESAAIMKEVTKWNEKLAEDKYKNKTLFLDQYIDDRVENLKPIK